MDTLTNLISSFITFFFNTVSFLLSYLPDIPAYSSITTAITTIGGYISSIYSFIPFIITTILAILAFDILFETGYFLFKIIYWVIRRIPTQS
jgi:hypothetical protein